MKIKATTTVPSSVLSEVGNLSLSRTKVSLLQQLVQLRGIKVHILEKSH